MKATRRALHSPGRHIAAILFALSVAPAAAQQQVQIEMDHRTREVSLQGAGGGAPQTFKPGEAVRIPSGAPVQVWLANTNSALYSCKVSQEPLAVPELDTLKIFLSGIGDYLPAISRVIAARGGPLPLVSALDQASIELEREIATLDSIVNGSSGMREARGQVVAALSEMRLTPGAVDPAVAQRLGKWFRDRDLCVGEDCAHLRYPAQILASMERIRAKNQEVKQKLAAAKQQSPIDGANADRVTESFTASDAVIDAAEKALGSGQETLHDAYALEKLAVRTIRATSRVRCDVVEVSWDEGRTLTFNVAPRAGDELAPIATVESYEHKMAVLPRWGVRPAVGLSFLVAPRAEYSKYSAAETDDGFRITENGLQDSRFEYGLTLGLTYRGLDGRQGSGVALWLPELTVNPQDDVRAVGIGAGVSYGIVKLGVGQLFTRHEVLRGQRAGDLIPSAEALQTRETFGRGRWYGSISLIGLPPFLPGSD